MEEIIATEDQNTETKALGPEERPEVPEYFTKLVKHCLEMYDQYKDSKYRKTKIDEIKEAREAYDQVDRKDLKSKMEDASCLNLPLTTITVDNQEPRFVAALVGKEPFINFNMSGMEKKDEGTILVEDFFNKELKETVKIENYCMNHIHMLLNEGTVFPIPEYTLEEKVVRDFKFDQNGNIVMKTVDVPAPVTDQIGNALAGPDGSPLMQVIKQSTGEPDMEETTVIEREGGKIELVPFKDMFYADDLGTVEEWENGDKIRRVYPTYAELQRAKDKKGYMNIGPWLLKERTGKEITEEEKLQTTQDGSIVTGKETIEAIECHITYPIYRDDTKEENEQSDFTEAKIIVTIALKSKVPIRLLLNRDVLWTDESMIKRNRLYPEYGRSCGTPVYGKLRSIQKGCSDMFNAVLDIAYICMLPWFFYDDKAGLKGEISLYAGKGVKVDNVQGILIPQFHINPAQYLEFVNIFMSMWERVGNLSDWNMGLTNQAGGKKTASEVLAVIQEGNISHNYRANTLREEFISIIKTLYDLYYQYMPLDKSFVFQGRQVQIPRKLMKRNYKFVLSGSTDSANKMIERKTSEDLLNMFGGDPLIDPVKPRENVLKNYGVDDPAEWINPDKNMLLQAFDQNPEIKQVVGAYLKDKMAIAAQAKSIPAQVQEAAGGMQ